MEEAHRRCQKPRWRGQSQHWASAGAQLVVLPLTLRKEEAFFSLGENRACPGTGSEGDFSIETHGGVGGSHHVTGLPASGFLGGCFGSGLCKNRCPASNAAQRKGFYKNPG